VEFSTHFYVRIIVAKAACTNITILYARHAASSVFFST
jgi:hypothetical protein